MAVTAAAVAKAAATVLSNEKTRKGLGWVIVAILSPFILIIVVILSLLSGTSSHNTNTVDLCFYGGNLPGQTPIEYRSHVEDMQNSFALLSTEIAALNEMSEDGPIDPVRVKAIFYSLFFEADTPSRRAHRTFVECFVRYEEREREVEEEVEVPVEPTASNPNPDPPTETITVTITETYTVAVPISNLDTIYANIASGMGVAATPEQKANAEDIYHRIAGHGYGEYDYDPNVPFVGMDGFVSPVGDGWRGMVTSEYGWRDDPMNPGQTALHRGIDLAAGAGYPIVASLDGTVIYAGWHDSWGNYVKIDHGGGFTTLYAHNTSLLVSTGQEVTAGQQIATMGGTGDVTGVHLHFEIAIGGELKNPRAYIP